MAGGTPQGLAVVTEFAGIARARVAEVFGRDPDQLYLVTRRPLDGRRDRPAGG